MGVNNDQRISASSVPQAAPRSSWTPPRPRSKLICHLWGRKADHDRRSGSTSPHGNSSRYFHWVALGVGGRPGGAKRSGNCGSGHDGSGAIFDRHTRYEGHRDRDRVPYRAIGSRYLGQRRDRRARLRIQRKRSRNKAEIGESRSSVRAGWSGNHHLGSLG